jgi:hypothetical protein
VLPLLLATALDEDKRSPRDGDDADASVDIGDGEVMAALLEVVVGHTPTVKALVACLTGPDSAAAAASHVLRILAEALTSRATTDKGAAEVAAWVKSQSPEAFSGIALPSQ